MSELIPIWTNSILQGSTPPPAYPIPNNPNAKTLKINNQSRYWLLLSKKGSSVDVDRIEPYSFLIMPFQADVILKVDTTNSQVSSLNADIEFVDYSTIDGTITYMKGSTQFNGSSTVHIGNEVFIDNSSLNVVVQSMPNVMIQGTTAPLPVKATTDTLQDASGLISIANGSQPVLSASTRRYFYFQNQSTSHNMYVNFGSAASIAGSYMLAPGASIVFDKTFVPSDAVYVLCDTAAEVFTCKWA